MSKVDEKADEKAMEARIRKARIELTLHPEKSYEILKSFALELTQKRVALNPERR